MRLAIVLSLLALLAGSECKKNILLVICDDLRPALGCYGDRNAYTPNIDLFAKSAFKFNFAYAQQALCAPSRNSLLTSRRPDSLYLYDFYSYWRLAAGNFTTLPQHFKQHGYTTASFGKVFHPGVSSNWSDDSPYSWSLPAYHAPTERYKDSPVCMDSSGSARRNAACPVEVSLQPGGTLPDIQVLRAAQKFITKHQSNDKPFFAAVGFHKPHLPLKYPRHFLDYHPLHKVSRPEPPTRPATMPAVAWNPWTDLRERDDVADLNLTFPYQPVPPEFTQVLRQSYYAAVSYVDDLVGKLLATLEQQHLVNNTIVLVTGDHGWSMGEHQEWGKYSNFEVAVKVPLIIYDPEMTHVKKRLDNSVTGGLSSDSLVELVDIFPTLCDLAYIPRPRVCGSVPSPEPLCTEGTSLVPAMYGGGSGKQAVFSQYPRPGKSPSHKSDQPRLKDIKIMGYSMRTSRHRYTEWVKFTDLTPQWADVVATEMYDHHIDPQESLNLAGRTGLEQMQRRLRAQLRAGWRAANTM